MNLIIQKACTYFLIKTTVEKFIPRKTSELFVSYSKLSYRKLFQRNSWIGQHRTQKFHQMRTGVDALRD